MVAGATGAVGRSFGAVAGCRMGAVVVVVAYVAESDVKD